MANRIAGRKPAVLSRAASAFRGALLGLLWLFVVPALAQTKPPSDKPIEIEQATLQPPVQTGRPIPTWWDVKIRGSSLVEGRFEFLLRSEGKLLATVVTEELSLAGPQQRIRVMLPPVDDSLPIDQLQVDVSFRSRKLSLNLGSTILRIARAASRTFVVLTSTSRVAPKRSAERDRLMKRLAFESMTTTVLQDMVKTVYVPFEPADLPQEPLAYCAYDAAVLFGNEFRSLKKPQLDALTAWVRAGGSLYVEPTGVLEPYHVDFLRGLTAADSRGLVFQPDSAGKLIPGTVWGEDRIVTTTSGLGHVVIHVEEEDATGSVDTPAWRRATAFLWRLRAEQIEAVASTGELELELMISRGGQPFGDVDGDGQPDFVKARGADGRMRIQMPQGWMSLKLPASTGELLDRLMPDGVRMVPLWLLGLILFGFVLLIGPVDYFGLGWLKARKYTWLAFPLATVLVTGLTVWLSNAYMSSAETRRGLVLRDVGDDGQVVRTNRFELLFVASTRPVSTDVSKGVFSPMGTGGAMGNYASVVYQQQLMMYNSSGRMRYTTPGMRGDMPGERTPPRIDGRIPTQYTVTQDLAKWTPQLNRLFWIPGSADEAPIDWNALVAGTITIPMLDSHTISNELLDRARKQFGAKVMVACLGSEGKWAYDRNGGWRNAVNGRDVDQAQVQFAAAQMAYQGYYAGIQLPQDIQQQGELFRWLYQHSVALPRGLFGLASRIGPKGGPLLDDLPLLDPSDSGRALLVIAIPVQDDFVVYRKLVPISK